MKFLNEQGETYASIEGGRLVLKDGASCYIAHNCRLDLSGIETLVELPAGLRVANLNLRGCTGLARLPEGLDVRHLTLVGCTGVSDLPRGLTCDVLNLQGTRVRSLPDDLCVSYRLDLTGCRELTQLPAGLRIGLTGLRRATPTGGSLILRDCTALESLPDGLDVCYLDLRGCTRLTGWPEGTTGRVGRLLSGGCSQLTSLPGWLDVSRLDVTDCTSLASLPEGIRVGSEIEIANTALVALPDSVRNVRLRWRGVEIPPSVAFRPDTITARDVLCESNAELRRVLCERMGLERFLSEAKPVVLDVDRDAGGERRLLTVPMPGDEDLVCVLVRCPSTGHRYILRVPPTMRTCREAVAWTAGFDDPESYLPLSET
jgi:hypothetical protein